MAWVVATMCRSLNAASKLEPRWPEVPNTTCWPGSPPASLGELALALPRPDPLVAALRSQTTPARQVLDALLALGEHRTRSSLVTLLDGPPGPEHEQAVDALLAELGASAL